MSSININKLILRLIEVLSIFLDPESAPNNLRKSLPGDLNIVAEKPWFSANSVKYKSTKFFLIFV